MLKFDFTNETKTKVSKKFFGDILKRFEKVLGAKIGEYLGKRNGQIDVVLVDIMKIWAINKEYRKKDDPTDVITFAYLEVTDYKKQKGTVIVGDIFICPEVAAADDEELEVLFVHGLLHLFGFDHKTKKQEKDMEEWAGKILKKC